MRILQHEDGRSKVGGFLQLSIFQSAEIIQQEHPCFPLFRVIPKYNNTPILTLLPKDSLKGSLSFSESFSVSGAEKGMEIKAFSDVDTDYQDFQDFYDTYLQGKNLCVEVVNMNGVTRVMNPVRVKCQYAISPEYSTSNTFELLFEPAKFNEYKPRKIIKTVTAETRFYSGAALSDCTVELEDYCNTEVFKYGYSAVNDLSQATFLNSGNSPVFQAVSDGKYYFFAVNKSAPTLFESYYINLNIAETINTDSENGKSVDGDISNNDYNGSVDGV